LSKKTTIIQDIPNKIRSKDCAIEIHGLGYVGFPLLVRLAISGFRTIGIDKDDSFTI